MFRFLNKIIRNNPVKKALGSSSGQVAVVLILIIAALLIFYAVSINFGKFSDIKAVVSISANTSASMLASSMASYGQMLSETSLKGGRKICAWTGIIAAIIVIIIIIIVIYTQQYYLLEGAAAILAVVGLALAVVSLALQIAVIQPGITDAWNRIINKTLSLNNQFTENAIQSGLGKVVTDRVTVPDVTDMDLDRLWVSSPSDPPPWEDEISRYSAYYSRRLLNIAGTPTDAIREFIEALRDFITADGTGDWGGGIHDHMDTALCAGTSECHPCCVPVSATTAAGDTFEDLRPEECDDGVTDWELECGRASPYYIGNPDDPQPTDINDYPWMYEPAYENPTNAIYSFRELIGQDDEHRDFYKVNELGALPWDPNEFPQIPHIQEDKGKFYLEDATGYYPPDNRTGVYPWMHKLKDWGLSLHEAEPGNFDNDFRECQLCDPKTDPATGLIVASAPGGLCYDCVDDPDEKGFIGPFPHPADASLYKQILPQLSLPVHPLDDLLGDPLLGKTLVHNTTYHVDGENLIPGNPPLWVDKVRTPTNIVAGDFTCAEDLQVADGVGFWKEGGDRFCSKSWQYFLECSKHAGSGECGANQDCACGQGSQPKSAFPEDAVDGIYYGLAPFIDWAETTIELADADLEAFAAEFVLWYPEAARWIEEGPGGLCYSCDLQQPNQGILHVFRAHLEEIQARIYRWQAGECGDGLSGDPLCWNFRRYEGNTALGNDRCSQVWCVPPEDCPLVQDDERDTFSNSLHGSFPGVDDIMNCLNHNAFANPNATPGPGGNAQRFGDCLTACLDCQAEDWTTGYPSCSQTTNAICGGEPNTHLPRSLIPDFDPNDLNNIAVGGFEPIDYDYIQQLLGCPVTCQGCYNGCSDCIEDAATSLATCRSSCNSVRSSCRTACAGDSVCEDICDVDRSYCRDNPNWPTTVPFNYSSRGCTQWYLRRVGWENGSGSNCELYDCGDNLSTCNASCGVMQSACIDGCALASPPIPNCTTICSDEFTQCDNTCANRDANCRASGRDCADAGTPACAAGMNEALCKSECECNATGQNCETDYGPDPIDVSTDPPPQPTLDEIEIAKGSCGEELEHLLNHDPADPDNIGLSFLDLIDRSIPEAQNQVAKFEHRLRFLSDLYWESRRIIEIFRAAEDAFDAFLSGPAADLIRARIAYDENDSGLPYHAIYGWQDKPDPDTPSVPGKWHVVKVEARIPGNCDGRCGPGQSSPDSEWPKIETYTKSWGTKRCYELRNIQGSVKFRTTRYDEERISDPVNFPNNLPIWQFRSAHPKRLQGADYQPGGRFDPAQLESFCSNSQIDTFIDGSPTEGIYDGAFMMEDYIGFTQGSGDNSNCWNLAHELLARGVVDETCAEYFWDGASDRMNFRFVPCLPF